MKDIDKDLHEMDSESLNQILDTIQEKLKVKQIRRNYIQMDRDMVEKFFLNTKTQRDDIERQIQNKETKAQSIEMGHRAEIKYYMQKVKHLEFEQEQSNLEIAKKGQDAMGKEEEYTQMRKKAMTE